MAKKSNKKSEKAKDARRCTRRPTSNLVDAAQQISRILVDAERSGLPQLVRPIAAT
jgi:hypothetical protein